MTAWIATSPDGPWTPLLGARGFDSEPSTWAYDEATAQVAVTASWTGGYTFLMTRRERLRLLLAFGLSGGRQLLHNGRKPTARRKARR